MQRFSFICVGLCFVFSALSAARAEFHAEFVQIPITAAAINASPQLATAQTWQLQVTADHDLLSMEIHVRVSGATLFQHPLGIPDGPPSVPLQAAFPSLAFDSYLDLPGDSPNAPFVPTGDDLRSHYSGPFDFTPTSVDRWLINTSNDPPPVSYVASQLTLVPTEGAIQHDWLVRFYEQTPGQEVIEHVVASPGLFSPFGGDANYDFRVDHADFEPWSNGFGQVGGAPFEFSPPGRFVDLDGDGDTDHFDGGILLLNQGASPATPQQGDVDGDGVVDADDRKVLFDYEWGHKWNAGDLNQDLRIDGADFLQWQQQFGNGFSATHAIQLTPEPSSATLIASLLAIPLFGVRRLIGSSDCNRKATR